MNRRQLLQRWFPRAEIVRGRDLGGTALSSPAAVLRIDHVAHVLSWWRPGDWRGLITDHRRPDDGDWCAGSVWFANRPHPPGVNAWEVEQESPLTLSPSLACPRCSVHGWIREGRWIDA